MQSGFKRRDTGGKRTSTKQYGQGVIRAHRIERNLRSLSGLEITAVIVREKRE